MTNFCSQPHHIANAALPKPKKKKTEEQSSVRKNSTPIVQLMPIPSKVCVTGCVVLGTVSPQSKKFVCFFADPQRKTNSLGKLSFETDDQTDIAKRRCTADKFVIPVDWTW